MDLTVSITLTEDELGRITSDTGRSFMSADDITEHLRDIIRRDLADGVDIGYVYRMTYYREDEGEDHGYRMYQHTFQGPGWPHIDGRPRMVWDGHSMKSRGGAFVVDAQRGIVDQASGSIRR